MSSLGVQRGDMLVVSSLSKDVADPASARVVQSNKSKPSSPAALVNRKLRSYPANANDSSEALIEPTPSRLAASPAEVDDVVPVDGGFLILRVRRWVSQL